MTTSKQSPNTTHRKRLARRLSEATGLPYTQALARVIAASETGLLPTPLEPAGMDAALDTLVKVGALLASAPDPLSSADTDDLPTEAGTKVHKARPDQIGTHCAVCMQPIKRVPGGQGPTWIHTDTGFVAASGGDPAHPLHEQTEDTLARDQQAVPSFVGFAHEGNPVPRCTATSWRAGADRRGDDYGPGGFNRCVKKARHESERHIDEWGNVFELDPKFRVIKNVTRGEAARVAAKDGIVLIDAAGNPVDPALLDAIFPYRSSSPDGLAEEVQARLRQNLLVQTKANEVLKISEIENDSVTAQVVYPNPPRTTVRRYTYDEAATWREPSDVMVRKYERAWGFSD